MAVTAAVTAAATATAAVAVAVAVTAAVAVAVAVTAAVTLTAAATVAVTAAAAVTVTVAVTVTATAAPAATARESGGERLGDQRIRAARWTCRRTPWNSAPGGAVVVEDQVHRDQAVAAEALDHAQRVGDALDRLAVLLDVGGVGRQLRDAELADVGDAALDR